MPPLIRFLIESFLTGAAIGIAVGLALALSMQGSIEWALERPLAAGLICWGFASTFGIGYLGTAIASLGGE